MFSFGGLATGLDTKALIDGLMAAERIPWQRLQTKQRDLVAAQSTVSDLVTRFAAVGTAAAELADASDFDSFAATSSSDAVVASSNGASVGGSFSLQVDQLALEQRTLSTTYASSTAALGQSGNLDITVGSGATVSIAIDAADSLVDIAAKINQGDAGVSAQVIFDGSQYRMMVRGNDTGADNAVTFAGVDVGLADPANTYQQAQDAQVVLDGQIVVTSSSNQINGLIDGVDLVLTAETAAPVTITLASDSDALVAKISSLVEAFNDAVSMAQSVSGYGALEAKHDELASDRTIRSALTNLAGVVSGSVPGLGGKYDMLASVGMHLTRNGKLELDEDALTNALGDDPAAVRRLFVGDSGVDGAMTLLQSTIDALANDDGMLTVRAENLGKEATRLEEDALKLDLRLDRYETLLVEKFTALELLVSRIQLQEAALTSLAGLGFQSYRN